MSTAGTLVGLGLYFLLGTRALGSSPAGGLRLVPVGGRRSRRPVSPAQPEIAVMPATAELAPPPARVEQIPSGSFLHAPLRFREPPARGIDRCAVVSRLVPLRSDPDGYTGALMGRLDVGDEVDVLRQEGPNCYVRTPTGAEGWVPGLSLIGFGGSAPEAPADDR